MDVENDVYSKRVRFSEEKTYVLHQNFTDYVYGKEMELCGDQKIFLEVTFLILNQVEIKAQNLESGYAVEDNSCTLCIASFGKVAFW